jgi:hypothetical protein
VLGSPVVEEKGQRERQKVGIHKYHELSQSKRVALVQSDSGGDDERVSAKWSSSIVEERLNGENGLLLTPSIDLLFDRGFIGFEDSGNLIISPVAHKPSLQRMGLETKGTTNVGTFTDGQRQFLEFHRNAILLRVAR